MVNREGASRLVDNHSCVLSRFVFFERVANGIAELELSYMGGWRIRRQVDRDEWMHVEREILERKTRPKSKTQAKKKANTDKLTKKHVVRERTAAFF